MTDNQKKAQEFAQDRGHDNQSITEAFVAALDMAEWKDEQHAKEKQQFIDKACEWWKNEFIYPTMTQSEIDWYQTKITDFKQAMEGE